MHAETHPATHLAGILDRMSAILAEEGRAARRADEETFTRAMADKIALLPELEAAMGTIKANPELPVEIRAELLGAQATYRVAVETNLRDLGAASEAIQKIVRRISERATRANVGYGKAGGKPMTLPSSVEQSA